MFKFKKHRSAEIMQNKHIITKKQKPYNKQYNIFIFLFLNYFY